MAAALLARVAAPGGADNPFRRRRFARFRPLVEAALAARGACSILDLGGTPAYWRAFGPDLLADPRLTLTLLNLDAPGGEAGEPGGASVRLVAGDARDLSAYGDGAFDIVHSNSVIEHVGRWADMKAMAAEARRAGRTHFVQTPYWGFPLEPHCRTPLFHYLPEQWRYRLTLARPLGFWPRSEGVDAAMARVQSSYLLDRRQFGTLFPASVILSEVVYGLTKSLIAVGGEGVAPDPASNTRWARV